MKYFGNWSGVGDVHVDFAGTRWGLDDESKSIPNFPSDPQILFAEYETPSYEGYAFVLFERDGKLYEVNGSHCSCYGLEGQWEPDETTWEALAMRQRACTDSSAASDIAFVALVAGHV